jgi:hypothetical protein
MPTPALAVIGMLLPGTKVSDLRPRLCTSYFFWSLMLAVVDIMLHHFLTSEEGFGVLIIHQKQRFFE